MTLQINAPADVSRLKCPVCLNYIGSTDGGYFEGRPCECGAVTQVTIPKEKLSKFLTGKRRCDSLPA